MAIMKVDPFQHEIKEASQKHSKTEIKFVIKILNFQLKVEREMRKIDWNENLFDLC